MSPNLHVPKIQNIKIEPLVCVNLVALKDHLGVRNSINENKMHLKMTIEWIKNAQDATGNGGVSAFYSSLRGWETAYPETTGYIIPTMFDYYYFSQDDDCRQRAIKMSDFLLNIQLDNGSFKLGFHPSDLDSEVFDTGQCMQGLLRCYKETKNDKYLQSAIKAGNWIVSVQDDDGAWRKYSYHGIPHTYYTRVAQPLMELHEAVGSQKYKKSAIKNVEYALANCNEAGWYSNCAFNNESMHSPITHVIAYTIEGILECGIMLNDRNFIKTATITLDSIQRKFTEDGWLKGSYDKRWESQDKYGCLTGNAQIAWLWLRLFELTKERVYYDNAVKLNTYLKSTQNLSNQCKGISGGIKGSQPIYGKYLPNHFLNWAAKFFADSLMKQETLRIKKETPETGMQM